jgi:hypothetical protein
MILCRIAEKREYSRMGRENGRKIRKEMEKAWRSI